MNNAQPITEIPSVPQPRIKTDLLQFDKFLGDGFVASQAILLAGMPGAGKSTMILQLSKVLANKGYKILYVSGEESKNQIKIRSDRLSTNIANIYLSDKIELENIIESINTIDPNFVIIDSIQTLWSKDIDKKQRSDTQIEETFAALREHLKVTGRIMLAIGQANKSGDIGGLLSFQHMVDTTLFIKVDRKTHQRTFLCYKNRFGSIDNEIDLHMQENGFIEFNADIPQQKQPHTSTQDYVLLNGKPYVTKKSLTGMQQFKLWFIIIDIILFALLIFH